MKFFTQVSVLLLSDADHTAFTPFMPRLVVLRKETVALRFS